VFWAKNVGVELALERPANGHLAAMKAARSIPLLPERGVLDFAAAVRRDLRDLRPRDMIDIQSFLWVQGSDEYPG
jgi:hypothetical protein